MQRAEMMHGIIATSTIHRILRRIQTINVDSVIMIPKERSICFRHEDCHAKKWEPIERLTLDHSKKPLEPIVEPIVKANVLVVKAKMVRYR